MTAAMESIAARPAARPAAGPRPGANWAGWVGYAPTVRGPEARRARAAAAGLLEPASPATLAITEPRRCSERRRPVTSPSGAGAVVRFDPNRRATSAWRATPPQRPGATLM